MQDTTEVQAEITVPLSELIALRDQFKDIAKATGDEIDGINGQVKRAAKSAESYAWWAASSHLTILIEEAQS